MKAIAKELGNHIAKNSSKPVSVNVIAYAIEGILGELVKIVAFALIGWLLNCFVEMMIVVFTFIILRTATGGPHCSSSVRCFILGGVTFTPLALVATLATTQFVAVTLIITCFFTAFGVSRWVPGMWHQRKLKKPKETYQNVSTIMIIVFQMTSTLMLLVDKTSILTIALAIQLGTLWQFVNLSPFGYKLIHSSDQLMVHINSIFKKGGNKFENV